MIRLEKVNENTFGKVVDMKVVGEQNKYVAPNVVSLAQAWLYSDIARPFAILNDDEVVGFVMLAWDLEERTVGIWRLMIEPSKQNNGYGRRTIELVIEMAKKDTDIDFLNIDYVLSNEIGKKLYRSLGFRETGVIDDGEAVMILPITNEPKICTPIADEDEIDDIKEMLVFEDIQTNDDELKELLKNKEIKRLSLMGETVGVIYKGKTIVDPNQTNYKKIMKLFENN